MKDPISRTPDLPHDTAAAPAAARPKRRVLVVEDDEETRQLLALYLRSLGYDVVEATSGVRALELIEEHAPPIVLIDWGLR